MKTSITIICCGLLALYGSVIALSDSPPNNTISAQPAPLNLTQLTKDTIKITNTVRDTVVRVKYKTKYKIKKAPCTTCDSVSAAGSSAFGPKMTPDTLPTKLYRIHGTIEQIE